MTEPQPVNEPIKSVEEIKNILFNEIRDQKQLLIDDPIFQDQDFQDMISSFKTLDDKADFLYRLIKAYDENTARHCNEVTNLALKLLDKSSEKDIFSQDEMKVAALIHNVGKIFVPLNIFSAPGKLSPEEHKEIKKHVEYGQKLAEIFKIPIEVTQAFSAHHERWDGKGYTQGLKQKEIPLGGRVLTIVDVFEAMTDKNRVYKEALTPKEAIIEMQKEIGQKFDPELLKIFIEMKKEDIKNE